MKKKLIILAIIIALFAVCFSVDLVISKIYHFEVISVSPEKGVADGNQVVTMVVQLKLGNKAVPGHDIYVITDRGRIGRKTTDENGLITISYSCYFALNPSSVKDVDIVFYNEDNSVFIYVPSKFVYTLEMTAPEPGSGNQTTVDTIFYD